VNRRPTYNPNRSPWASYVNASDQAAGKVSYGECTLLTSVLSRPYELGVIPKACRYDEANNVGRIHSFHNDHTLYNIARRMTKTIAPAGVTCDIPNTTYKDPAQEGLLSMKECAQLAVHLHSTFGVTHLLPKSCDELLAKAQGRS